MGGRRVSHSAAQAVQAAYRRPPSASFDGGYNPHNTPHAPLAPRRSTPGDPGHLAPTPPPRRRISGGGQPVSHPLPHRRISGSGAPYASGAVYLTGTGASDAHADAQQQQVT
jgi:hypothetical protein